VIANKMEPVQRETARKLSFGNLFAGRDSRFFFRSWKRSYRLYSEKVEKNFNRGYCWVADFDLVACYELIDHRLLRAQIEKRVGSPDLLNLLFKCLAIWTTNASGRHLRHGLPQGPEASAFLAECLLFQFDQLKYRNVKYLRYVDDIRLMAKSETPLRRALLSLDLKSKDLGLVPQVQKILVRSVATVDEILKSIPSGLAGSEIIGEAPSQRELLSTWRETLHRQNKTLRVTDDTKFKYVMLRLNPRREVLRRIAPLLVSRPDLSWILSKYLQKFPNDEEAANILFEALKQDPTYDLAAAHYIEALDVCEPSSPNAKYRRVIQTATRRSQEDSVLLEIAALTFRCRRSGPRDAVRLVDRVDSALVRSVLLDRVFVCDEAPHKLDYCLGLLEKEVKSKDGCVAQYAALHRLYAAMDSSETWNAPRKANRATILLLLNLGLRHRRPSRRGVILRFLETRGIRASFTWKRALKQDFKDAEHRCVRLQHLMVGDPTARIMMLDTFNEVLIQRFSQDHPVLGPAFFKAAGSDPHPDYGNWIRHGLFVKELPVGCQWYLDVHKARVRADLAHAKSKRGKWRGKPTREITYSEADALMRGAVDSWKELTMAWASLI